MLATPFQIRLTDNAHDEPSLAAASNLANALGP
jgi:hypothetical protein